MSAEKAPLLPMAGDRLQAEKAAGDGIPHSSSIEQRGRKADRRFWVRIGLPLYLTLLALFTLVKLPALLGLYRAVTNSSTLSLYSYRHHPRFSNDELKEILVKTPSNDSAAEWLRYYTAGPHLAGQNYSQAAWTRDRWAEWGAAAHITAYDLYLNTPVDHGLALLKPAKGKKRSSTGEIAWEVDFRASLEEDVIDDDPTTALKDRVPTFHGYSASGNVTGPVVYVNYGTYQDYADLERANISLKGTIALARYGGIFRGLKVKRAQELGAVGVLLYSDPGDDGEATEANGYETYPDGPARQPSSVQRGSVQFLSIAPGDPTTPGYPSKPGVPRGPTERYIPQIPSLPISYADALPILKALNGHGPTSKDLGRWWTRNEGLGGKGVQYNIGPTPADEVQVNLYNEVHYTTTPIWNVLGIFNGSVLPNEVVVVGNHRDAWIAGGAVDPNSGSAVVNEVVRAFGVAYAKGWRPLRTIVFASWDGEEYGLLGSTEWVEEYLPWLQHTSLAYVNIDTGVGGPHFGSAAVPLVHDLIYAVTGEVLSPNQTVPGQTVRDTWSGNIGPLGSGSDYTAFLDHAGIVSLDVRFSGGGGDGEDASAASSKTNSKKNVDPVYHYHSNYDSYYWMATYGDPGFHYHQTISQLLGLLVARLATDWVVPFRAADYAHALHRYVDQIRTKLDSHGSGEDEAVWSSGLAVSDDTMVELRGRRMETASTCAATAESKRHFQQALDRLDSAVAKLATQATALDAKADKLRLKVSSGEDLASSSSCHADGQSALVPRWWRRLLRRVHRIVLAFHIASVNRRYQFLERKFLYGKGLDDREWFKHVVFAPGVWTGYAGAVFPGLVESIDAGDWKNGIKWARIIEDRVKAAAKGL